MSLRSITNHDQGKLVNNKVSDIVVTQVAWEVATSSDNSAMAEAGLSPELVATYPATSVPTMSSPFVITSRM